MDSRRQQTGLIGQRIRHLRKQKGFLLKDVQEASGLHPAFVSRIELGRCTPSLATLERFARVLDVPLYQLFWAGEEPTPAPLPISSQDPEDLGVEPMSEARFLSRLAEPLSRLTEPDREVLLGLASRLVARAQGD
ncbi:MAG TPA: helix-turn-helix transcriptional regulator [Terriglobia bacterium]|nr:helix-turn-helix transcriptional regulator [Terriglobia bacterium]